jgi:hypothetical protein
VKRTSGRSDPLLVAMDVRDDVVVLHHFLKSDSLLLQEKNGV